MRTRHFLRLAFVLLLPLGLLPATPAMAAEFDVAVQDFVFTPSEIVINAGDTVTWTWDGQAPHNVTPVDETAFVASETITEGDFAVTFASEGSVPYFCTIHAAPDGSEGMIGVVTVLAQGEPLPPPTPDPRPAPEPGRLPAATDNIGTSLAWSSLFADGTSNTVALARDDLFADSLTSGAVQGLVDGPLLLTSTASLDDRVAAELTRLGAQTVVILGGENAIAPGVEQTLRDLGYTVERIQGITRIETANAVAETYFPDATSAILVRSDAAPGGDPTQAFADSLPVGGAAARASIPILLSQTDRLSDTTTRYLTDRPSIRRVTVIGGEAALSAQVVTDLEALGIEVVRLGGETRFDTSVAIAFAFYPPPQVFILVDGQGPDAWVSGFTAASAAESAPIILSNGEEIPPPVLEPLSVGVPALCGPDVAAATCDRAGIASSATQVGEPGQLLLAVMAGVAEVPGPGASDDATSDLLLKPTSADDALCYEMVVFGLGEPVTGAHIHTGAEGVAGDVVIPLNAPGADSSISSCSFDLDPAVVADVLANPADYYVNYHTETFPAGATRGQLFNFEFIGFAELQPDSEVPPADVSGGGFTALATDADDHTRLAYFLTYGFEDGTQAAAGHIHDGPAEENGPVVHPLRLPQVVTDGSYTGAFLDEGVDAALVEDVLANPGDYYVNLHTADFPAGAIRGQAFNPFGSGPPPASTFAGIRR